MKKPEVCKNCAIYNHQKGDGFCPSPDGSNLYDIKIVGEKAGPTESKRGKPFWPQAASGSKLNEIFKLLNKNRQGFKIGNIISCQPNLDKLEYTSYESDAISYCRQTHLYKWLKPDSNNFIFALGKIAMRELTEFSGLDRDKQSISHLRGYPIQTKYGWIVSSYHPAFVRRGKPQYTHYLRDDLQKLFFVKEHGWILPNYEFSYNPGKDFLRSYYYHAKDLPLESPLFYDIETDDSKDTEEDERQGLVSNLIKSIQFCYERDKAVFVDWSEDNLPFIKLMLRLPNFKVGFNSYNFDDPRILDKPDMKILGKRIDLMWMFKHWQPGLERGLQKVASLFFYPEPWKHKAFSEEGFYGCSDVNAGSYIYPKLKENMIKEGIWN